LDSQDSPIPSLKRWGILLAGILANTCQGAAYASSVFAKPMMSQLGCMKMGPDGTLAPDMTKWAIAFSVNLAFLPVGMLISGLISDRRGSRLVIALGGVVFGLGMFLAGFSTSFPMFLLTFGVLIGVGSGSAYGAIISTAVRWFPDSRGLASGLSVGALGFGTAIIAPVAVWLMSPDVAIGVPVLFAFRVLGAAILLIIVVASIVITNPPEGYKPAGFVSKPDTSVSTIECPWPDMIAKLKFWMLYITYACGAFSGLMIISQASPIAQDMTKLTKEAAAAIPAAIGLANACGRVFWGFVSDWIGRMQAVMVMFAITAVAMFTLPETVAQRNTLLVASVFIGLCYGGYLGIFPSVCADSFGAKNLSVNYALMFSAFSLAAIVGPQVGARVRALTGSYNEAFTIAGIVVLAGLLVTVIIHFVFRPKPVANS
jgi:MFS transporter, OFA family, oxalate/formate antiporter